MTSSLTKMFGPFALACFGLVAPTALLADAAPSPHDPLFNNDEPLTITLTGPFKTLDKQRDKSAEYDVGSLSYEGPDGPVSIETRYTPRGNFRLEKENCAHAQLWLNLKKKQTKKTVLPIKINSNWSYSAATAIDINHTYARSIRHIACST